MLEQLSRKHCCCQLCNFLLKLATIKRPPAVIQNNLTAEFATSVALKYILQIGNYNESYFFAPLIPSLQFYCPLFLVFWSVMYLFSSK